MAEPKTFTLADCPTPFPPFMAGAELPEISLTLPLEPGEDLTGATFEMVLVREPSNPLDQNILEKSVTEISNIVGAHFKGKVVWVSTDLIPGNGQQATFTMTIGGKKEPLARFNIDVFDNPDPNP